MQRGFTLLEVLVAIAILGLGLGVILGSQVGLFSSAARGEHLGVATNLVRCKMSEIEAELLTKGYQLTDESDEGKCCGDEDEEGYRCVWKIERVELPELSLEDGGTSSEGGASRSGDGGLDGLGVLGTFASLGQPGGSGIGGGAGISDLAQKFSGASSMGLAPMLMSLVYPSLKPMLEASIRKVSVTIHITEGKNDRELTVIQYVTSPQQGGLDALLAAGGAAGVGAPTGTSTSAIPGLPPALSPFLTGAKK
jgi:general secretion pathway protein I